MIYTPGKANVVADTLFRPPEVSLTAAEINNTSVDLPEIGAANKREVQLKDPEVGKIIQAFEGDNAAAGVGWA